MAKKKKEIVTFTKKGLYWDIDGIKNEVIPQLKQNMLKLKKEELIEQIAKDCIMIHELQNQVVDLSHRKTPKFTAKEVEEIKNDTLSIRKKVEKYGCAKRTIEKIMSGNYNPKEEK